MNQGSNQGVLSEAKRSDVERWLLARGVPHLVVDYTSEDGIWTRAQWYREQVDIDTLIDSAPMVEVTFN